MMKSGVILTFMGIILISACQKRKYPPEVVRPEKEDIFFNGIVDGEPINLKIGSDGYYCYSSFTQNSDSIYVFKGELKKYGCVACPLALRVELSDYRQRAPGASVPADSALSMGNRHFIPGLSKPGTLRFVSLSNKEISSVQWNFSNGNTSHDPVLNYEFSQPGPHTVSLIVRTKDNCESKIINRIFIDPESGIFACAVLSESLQNNIDKFTANISGGKPPFRYTWYFGDGSSSDLEAPLHEYKYTGSYPVKLLVEDADNKVCEANYIHVTANDKSSCAVNMALSFAGTRNAFLDGVKIQWTDRSNVVFRSDSIAQPADSYFEILNSQQYESNERGEPGRLLTFRVNVLLAAGSRQIWFRSESSAIVVSYE